MAGPAANVAKDPKLGAMLELERRGALPDNLRPQLQAYRDQGLAPMAASKAVDDNIEKAANVIDTARAARDQVGWGTTGVIGAAMAHVPGSSAAGLRGSIDTLKANLAFDQLADMRAKSPTGGAVGNVSDAEERLLSSTVASLDPHLPDDQLQGNFNKIIDHYGRWLKSLGYNDDQVKTAVSGAAALKKTEGAAVPGGGGEPPATPPPPNGDIGFNGGSPDQSVNDKLAREIAANGFTTPDQIIAFAKGKGVNLVPKDVQAYVDYVGKARAAGRNPAVPVIPVYEAPAVDPGYGAERTGAFMRGVGDTIPGSDRVRALMSTVADGGEYADNLTRQQGITRFEREQNIVPYGAGVVAGGVVAAPFMPGAGVRTAAEAAGVGAGYGALYGAANAPDLTDIPGVGVNALVGAGLGAGASAGLRAGGNYLSRRADARDLAVARAAEGEIQAPGSLPERRAAMESANRIGVELLPADVGGAGTRMASAITAKTFGGVPMAEAADRSILSAQVARDGIASRVGNVAADEAGAGQAAQQGARSFVDSSQIRAKRLYDSIPVKTDRPAQLTNTRAALRELAQGFDSNPELSAIWAENPRLKATLEALLPKTDPMYAPAPAGSAASGATASTRQIGTAFEGGQLSWGDLKRFRSIVGEIAGRPSLADDGNQIQSMRKLYGALSEDMRGTAAADGPAALRAFERANGFWRGREARMDGVLSDILGPDMKKGAQATYEQINRWAQQKGGDAKSLGVALRSLGEDANTVRATLISHMGQAGPGRQNADGLTFSPAEFVTQWNKLSARAKDGLFPDKEHRQALTDLARSTAAMKRATQYSNFSNTGLVTNAAAHVAGLATNPFATIAAAAGEFGMGKLLSSRRFARWLVDAGRVRNTALHIQRLSTIASRDPAIAQEALGLQQVLMRVANDNVGTVSRAAASDRSKSQSDENNNGR